MKKTYIKPDLFVEECIVEQIISTSGGDIGGTGSGGVINPELIDEYIAMDGYAALGKVLTEMTPQQVIDEILASGLRGLYLLPTKRPDANCKTQHTNEISDIYKSSRTLMALCTIALVVTVMARVRATAQR